jgi:mRNA interferase RelE/StbE
LGFRILYHKNIKKDLRSLDKSIVDTFIKIVESRISKNPFSGERLKGKLRDIWKYRIGSYRVLYTIHQDELRVLVLRFRHRKNVYDDYLF